MKNQTLFFFAFFAIITIVSSQIIIWDMNQKHNRIHEEAANIPFSFTVGSIHTTITIERNGQKIIEEYHAGAVTQLGLNFTFAKLTGSSTLYNMTQYNLNISQISIGNQGTLNTASTILPGEWNRTAATLHDGTYNSCNFTAVFHPDTGPYTADCIGLNFQSGIGQTNSLWGYDTFSESTGIDNTYTITVEIKVSAS
jgi:hypothetical protein